MKQLFILILSLLLANSSYGQGYLILTSNEEIPFEKLKFKTGTAGGLFVTSPGKKEKQQISINTVVGRYTKAEGILYYLKYNVNIQDYEFIEKELCGRINLYSKTVTTNTKYGSTTSTYYYIERSNIYEYIFSTNTIGQNKKEKIETLKSLVSDSPDVLNTIGEDFKLNPENLAEIVRKYNLATYEYKPPTDTTNFGTLIIYWDKNKINGQVRILANNENLSQNTENSLIAKIDPRGLTKICVGDTVVCELVEGNSFFTIYYELSVDKNSVYSFIKRSKEKAGFYVKGIK